MIKLQEMLIWYVDRLSQDQGCIKTDEALKLHCYHMGTAVKHPVPDRVKS